MALEKKHLSIQCVDNPGGVPGVVIYGDQTFPIFSQQGTAFEDAVMEYDPPETSGVSMVVPFNSSSGGEIPKEPK